VALRPRRRLAPFAGRPAIRGSDSAEEDEPPPAAADRSLGALVRRPWRLLDGRQVPIGFLFGLAATARLTVLFGAPFFVLGGGSWQRRAVSAGLGGDPGRRHARVQRRVTGQLFHPAYEFLYRVEAFATQRWLQPRLVDRGSAISRYPDHAVQPAGPVPGHDPAAYDYGQLCIDPGARGLFDEVSLIALPRDIGTSILPTSPALLLALPACLYGWSRLGAGRHRDPARRWST
jgi:hypothetical protein